MGRSFSEFEPFDYNDYVDEAPKDAPVEESPHQLKLNNYIDFLFPNMQPSEYIAVFLNQTKPHPKPHAEFFSWCEKENLKQIIHTYRYFNTYITLSTVTQVDGKLATSAEHMHRRCCIAFDFDKKDFNDKFHNIKDFTEHFHTSTGLWIHFAIDSGHGYHFYVGIEETTDIARVTAITRAGYGSRTVPCTDMQKCGI